VTDVKDPSATQMTRMSRFRRASSGEHSLMWRITYVLIRDGIPIALLLLWYFESFNQPAFILPNPLDVLRRTADFLGLNPDLLRHTLVSLARVGVAVVLAIVLGSLLVIVAYYLPISKGLIIDRLMALLNSFPALGWAILGVYWFRISNFGVIFVQVAVLLPYTMINMWEGLKNLDDELVEMARSFSRNRVKTLSKVVIPMLLPFFFASLRFSYGTGWKIALFAELFGAPSGVGFVLSRARENFESVTVYASTLVLVVLVFVFQKWVIDPLERRFTPHKDVEIRATDAI
jgi:NitT/TauT family transport system permease protein/sulfonate transport system permease protein